MNFNKAIVAGKLTRDPELKSLPSGSPVCTFSIATNRTFKDNDGKPREEVEYHNVIRFGNAAENIARFLCKGSSVLVEGRLQTRSWDKDGQKQYRTEIVADRVEFGPRASERKSGDEEPQSRYRYDKQAKPAEDVPKVEYPEEEINPEDIPF